MFSHSSDNSFFFFFFIGLYIYTLTDNHRFHGVLLETKQGNSSKDSSAYHTCVWNAACCPYRATITKPEISIGIHSKKCTAFFSFCAEDLLWLNSMPGST